MSIANRTIISLKKSAVRKFHHMLHFPWFWEQYGDLSIINTRRGERRIGDTKTLYDRSAKNKVHTEKEGRKRFPLLSFSLDYRHNTSTTSDRISKYVNIEGKTINLFISKLLFTVRIFLK